MSGASIALKQLWFTKQDDNIITTTPAGCVRINQSINQGGRFFLKFFLLLRALIEIRRRSLGVCRKIGHWPLTLSSVKMWGMSVGCDKWDESVRTPWAFPCRIKWRMTENGLTRHERLSRHYGHYTLLLLGSTWTNSFLSDRAINDKKQLW